MRTILNKKFLIVSSILLALVVFVVILLPSGSKKTTVSPPTATPSPASDNNTIPISNPENRKALKIISSTVPSRLLGLQEGFIITFSQTPSTSEFFYEITPEALVTMVLKNKSIFISPYPEWKPNTQYKILIKSGTKDAYGNVLNRNYEYSFKTVSGRGM